MCNVDLSDVTASILPEGEKATENTNAGSTPRRSSATLVRFEVENTRTKVPVSLAVARSDPSRLSSSARKGELCAGIMLIFPVLCSTT